MTVSVSCHLLLTTTYCYMLQNYGIRGVAYLRFQSCLSNRQIINNVASCLTNVLCFILGVGTTLVFVVR